MIYDMYNSAEPNLFIQQDNTPTSSSKSNKSITESYLNPVYVLEYLSKQSPLLNEFLGAFERFQLTSSNSTESLTSIGTGFSSSGSLGGTYYHCSICNY